MKNSAEMQDTLVAGTDIVVFFQIISDSAMSFVWMLFINLSNCR